MSDDSDPIDWARAVVDAATPGPYTLRTGQRPVVQSPSGEIADVGGWGALAAQEDADARYIALCSPGLMRALLRYVRAGEQIRYLASKGVGPGEDDWAALDDAGRLVRTELRASMGDDDE